MAASFCHIAPYQSPDLEEHNRNEPGMPFLRSSLHGRRRFRVGMNRQIPSLAVSDVKSLGAALAVATANHLDTPEPPA